MVAPMRRRKALPYLREIYGISERRACLVLVVNRRSVRYRSVKIDVAPLRGRIREIAATRVRYGYRRIHVLLRREGWVVNHKRVCRIYREEGLSMRHRPPKRRRSAMVRHDRVQASGPNQVWSMDFLADQLHDGRKIRLLAIVDNFTRECVALDVNFNFPADRVVAVLQKVALRRGRPQQIRVDNGPEFVSKQLDQWAYWNQVELDFSRPGKPTDNAFVESFNNRVRQELLNANWLTSMDEARRLATRWRVDYNTNHPHSALGNLSPKAFADRMSKLVS
jgi:putative transposase